MPIASLEQQMPKSEDETIVNDAGLSTIGTHYSKHCRRGRGQEGNEGLKTGLDSYPVWWIRVMIFGTSPRTRTGTRLF
jgi:hypothetical protein